jgi:hypothetical protein
MQLIKREQFGASAEVSCRKSTRIVTSGLCATSFFSHAFFARHSSERGASNDILTTGRKF